MSLRTENLPTLLDLVRLRSRTALFAAMASVGLILAGYGIARVGMPSWGGTLIFLGAITVPVTLKWRDDLVRWGPAVCALSVLLAFQAFHMVEHIVQMVQFYLLDLPPVSSQGLISSLNVEWVHFVWNWLVWGILIYLYRNGMKGVFMLPLIVWVTLHSLEHSYMMLMYVHTTAELGLLGLPQYQSAQVMPGILGRDGWLATNLTFLHRFPGLTTLPRVAVHFYWNLGETILLILAARESVSRLAFRARH